MSTIAVSITLNTITCFTLKHKPHLLTVINMGEHFFPMPPAAGDDFDCSDGMPLFQVTYWRGVLNGLVFSHFANLPSSRYEHPPSSAIPLIANEPPKCMLDLADQGLISTMHLWVDDYIVTCIGE